MYIVFGLTGRSNVTMIFQKVVYTEKVKRITEA